MCCLSDSVRQNGLEAASGDKIPPGKDAKLKKEEFTDTPETEV